MAATKSIREIQEEIIDEFAYMDDWMDRYALIIEMGNDLTPIATEEKIPENIIEGCQSRVWIAGHPQPDGTIDLSADSDAVIVKGIIAMLLKILSGQPAEEIARADLFFIEQLGLSQHLSPTRSNGLLAMVRHIKLIAAAVVAGQA